MPLTQEQVDERVQAWHDILVGPGHSANDLTPVAQSIFAHLATLPFEYLDFRKIPKDANALRLATSLRATFSHKETILGWDEGLLMCIDACLRDGVDARDALMGLL